MRIRIRSCKVLRTIRGPNHDDVSPRRLRPAHHPDRPDVASVNKKGVNVFIREAGGTRQAVTNQTTQRAVQWFPACLFGRNVTQWVTSSRRQFSAAISHGDLDTTCTGASCRSGARRPIRWNGSAARAARWRNCGPSGAVRAGTEPRGRRRQPGLLTRRHGPTARGRAAYREYLGWVVAEMKAGREQQYLQLSKGWAIGGEEFKQGLRQ